MLQALRTGRSPAEITEFLQVPRSAVYRIAKCVREEQSGDDDKDQEQVIPERKKESGPGKKRTSAFLQQVQELVQEDSMKSLRKLVRELVVSSCLVRQAVHDDLLQDEALQQKGRKGDGGSICS